MKLQIAIALISFVIIGTLVISSNATNSTWGWVGPYDMLLHREKVYVKSKWLQIVSRDVVYPASGYISTRTISAIKAIDHARKHGGTPSLYRGGPGYRNATIHLKSERGEGLNYTIEIFGR